MGFEDVSFRMCSFQFWCGCGVRVSGLVEACTEAKPGNVLPSEVSKIIGIPRYARNS